MSVKIAKNRKSTTPRKSLKFLQGGALTPPGHLSKEAAEQWTAFTKEYDFDDAGLLVLMTSLEAFDRMRMAQAELKAHGKTTFLTRYGELKPHPACAVETRNRSQYQQGLGSLGLDKEPIKEPGRPAGS